MLKGSKKNPELWPVLDVGCGEAYLIEELCKRDIPCYGIDLDIDQLTKAQLRAIESLGRMLPLIHGDAMDMPFKDNYFGYVVSFGTIMMVPYVASVLYGRKLSEEEAREEVKKILSEMKRVTRPGGEIFIITFSDKSRAEEYYRPNPEEFKEMLNDIGLIPHEVIYSKRDERRLKATAKKP